MAALTCTDIRELFSARIDDALSAEERARLDAHLATCAECPREWQSFERSVALVRGMEPARASAGFVDRVLAARPRPWYRRLGRSLLVPWPVKLPLEAAAIVLVAGLAILIVQGSPELQQAARAPVTPPASMPRTARPPVPVAKGESAQRTTPRTSASTEGQHLYALPDEAKERASEPAPADVRAEPPRSLDAGPPAGSPRVAAESRAKTADAGQTLSRQDTERERAAAPGQAASAPAAPAPTASAPAAPPAEALAPSSAGTAAPAPAARAMQKSGELRNVTAARANVQARLAASDPATSERAVRDLVTRAGGRIVSRAGDGDAAVLELAVPADRWDEVQRGLQALGSLRLDDTRGNGTDPVRILLRLER